MLAAVESMAQANGKTSFAEGYQKLIAAAANHIQLLSPFLPGLAAAMAG